MSNTVLILGSHGRFGRNAGLAFAAAGWEVRRFVRGADDLLASVRQADIVVNAWNPPDYSLWQSELLPLHQSVIEALRGTDIPVIVPGNVYVFGADTPQSWSETSLHGARNPLGQLRIRMEAAYRTAGIRTIILRGGDFLDTTGSGNWFDRIMIAKLARGIFVYPGNPDALHAWAYLPDMARAAVALADMREALPQFTDVPFPGFAVTGHQMAEALARVTGRAIKLKPLNWLPLRLLAPVWRMPRGLLEMRYLWNTPHRLDGARLGELLPDLPQTSLDDALRAAVGGDVSE